MNNSIITHRSLPLISNLSHGTPSNDDRLAIKFNKTNNRCRNRRT